MKKKMKQSIRFKLLTLFVLSLMGALSLSMALHFLLFRPYYLRHTEQRLLAVYEEVEASVDHPDFEDIVTEIDFRQQVGIMIADETFDYSFFSHLLTTTTGDKLSTELREIISTQWDTLEHSHVCVYLHEETTEGEENMARMVFIQKLSNGHYCILSHPLDMLNSSVEAMNQFHLIAGVIACFFGMLSTFAFSKSFTRPILEINKVTEKMSHLSVKRQTLSTAVSQSSM